MVQYPALLDGKKGAYGVVFPDIPGIGAMGSTINEAMANAEEVLRDYAMEAQKDGEELAIPSPLEAVETPPGNTLVSVRLTRPSIESVEAGPTGV